MGASSGTLIGLKLDTIKQLMRIRIGPCRVQMEETQLQRKKSSAALGGLPVLILNLSCFHLVFPQYPNLQL